jgi:CheY-like chemotaxis protein
VLQRLGYAVLAADGPAEAMKIMAGHQDHIHLLLTDVVMPGMSGPELARRLVQVRTDMKVLYTSGYPGDAISDHGVLIEGAEFIPKPFTPAALAAKVRALLDHPNP